MSNHSELRSRRNVNQHTALTVCCEHWFDCEEIDTIAGGRINDTFRVVRAQDRQNFVLQKINTRVFANAAQLMRQTERVVGYLESQQSGWVPRLEPTVSGDSFVEFERDGRFELWRLWHFVGDAQTGVPSPAPGNNPAPWLQSAGAAFSHTHTLLAGFPAADLVDPIPGLFDLNQHFQTLDSLVRATAGQALEPEVERCLGLAESSRQLSSAFSQRTGVIHGDCKPQNIMYRVGSSEVAAVLDLDTVMHGHWAWDYGDLIRSTAVVDGHFDMLRFAPLTAGFLQGNNRVDKQEVDALVNAPVYAASCLGLRYLIDHLRGDPFFKVNVHGDNLRRAQTRLGLLAQFDAARGAMERVVKAVG